MASGEQGAILVGMTSRRGHVADGAVTMLFVVPVDEAHGPFPRRVEIGEAFDRELRPVFRGAEQSFGVRVRPENLAVGYSIF